MSKKLLILSGSYGGGHETAAINLEEHYKSIGYQVKKIDIIDQFTKFWGKSSKKIYKLSSEEYPKVWEAFFNGTDYKIISRIFYGIKDPIGQPKFNKLIEKRKPNHVISVFPFWNGRIKNYRKNFGNTFKRGIVITDAINIQSFWYVRPKYVDQYFVFDDYTKKAFAKKFEIKNEKITVSFFPIIKEKFIEKTEIKGKKIIVLLTGLEEENTDAILSELKEFDITIIKGRNEKLYKKLKEKYDYNFIDFMKIIDYLKNYDFMIGKPGGAITAECLATNTPLIVPSFFPGQEEGNMELLVKTSTGIYENNPKKIAFLIKYLNWTKLLENFKSVKKTNSCEIIEQTLNNC